MGGRHAHAPKYKGGYGAESQIPGEAGQGKLPDGKRKFQSSGNFPALPSGGFCAARQRGLHRICCPAAVRIRRVRPRDIAGAGGPHHRAAVGCGSSGQLDRVVRDAFSHAVANSHAHAVTHAATHATTHAAPNRRRRNRRGAGAAAPADDNTNHQPHSAPIPHPSGLLPHRLLCRYPQPNAHGAGPGAWPDSSSLGHTEQHACSLRRERSRRHLHRSARSDCWRICGGCSGCWGCFCPRNAPPPEPDGC